MSIYSRRIEAQIKQAFLRKLTKQRIKTRRNRKLENSPCARALFTTNYHFFKESDVRKLVKSIKPARLHIAGITAGDCNILDTYPGYYGTYQQLAHIKVHGRCDDLWKRAEPTHHTCRVGITGLSKRNQERCKKLAIQITGHDWLSPSDRNDLLLLIDAEKVLARENQRIATYLANDAAFIAKTSRWIANTIFEDSRLSVSACTDTHLYRKGLLKQAIANGEARGFSEPKENCNVEIEMVLRAFANARYASTLKTNPRQELAALAKLVNDFLA